MPSDAQRAKALRAAAGPGDSYWRLSRAPRYSVLFALPLLLLYEALAAFLAVTAGEGVRNGADVMLKSAFIAVAGTRGPLIFAACLVGLGIWIVARDLKRGRGRLRLAVFGTMLVESAALALVFGFVVGGITSRLIAPLATMAIAQVSEMGVATRLMVSLGAGLYEELLFRVVLVSALLLLTRRVLNWPWAVAGTVSVVAGALIFSAFHYIGPYGDPLRLDSFVFRAVGGLAFSALYVTRGFGITAWTHALYDVFLLVV